MADVQAEVLPAVQAPAALSAAPRWVFGLLLAACWVLPLGAAPAGVLILAAAAGLLPWWLRARPPALPGGLPGLAFLAAGFLAAVFSGQFARSWPALALAAAYLLVMWVAGRAAAGEARRNRVLQALFWGAVPAALLGIVAATLRTDWSWSMGWLALRLGFPEGRASSIFLHPNILAGYLLLAAAAGLAVASGRWWRFGPPLALLGVCLLMTRSRSGWIGALAMLATLGGILAAGGALRALPRSRLALGAAAAALCLLGSAPVVGPRLLALADPAQVSGAGHWQVWRSAAAMIAQRPLLGWGPGTWSAVYPQFRAPAEFEHLIHAHSLYLHVGAEFGLLGLALLLGLVGSGAGRALRDAWPEPARLRTVAPLVAGIAGYLTMCAFDYPLSEGRNAIAFFAVLGCLAAPGGVPEHG